MLNEVLPISPLPSNVVGQLQQIDDFYACTRFTEDEKARGKLLSAALMCNQEYFNKGHTYSLSNVFLLKPSAINFERQLRWQGDFYICSHFTEEFVGPPIIIIERKAYYRFMKFIYLSQPPEELHTERVIKVCDLRLDYMDKLVDIKFNSYAMETMADSIRSTLIGMNLRLKTLDFGCGSGLSSQQLLKYLPSLDIMGIDASKKAIRYCHEQGLSAMHTSPGEPFPFETAVFVNDIGDQFRI